MTPYEKAARAEGWQILNGAFRRSTGDALAPWDDNDIDPTDPDAWQDLCEDLGIKVTFKVEVSDTITFQRTATIEIEAFDEEGAIELALDRANEGGLEWDEEQIDNTPYQAALVA